MADEETEEPERYELTPQERERRERALEHITQLGDPVLRTKAIEIRDFDADLVSLGAHMVSLMDDAIGVGLAAPQIGKPIRMFVYRVDGDGDARAVVNPVVTPTTDETDVLEEGCLSLVGVHVPVERPTAIRLTGLTVHGKPIDEEVTGFTARVVQHENDHLDGVLILERTTPEARRAALKELHAIRNGESSADASASAEPQPASEPA
ncbi:MAG: peptide deformylase [Solirubrobacteraceae bacterium]|nr:peptide deformylase [Solirubrobacteraceae bacterium]